MKLLNLKFIFILLLCVFVLALTCNHLLNRSHNNSIKTSTKSQGYVCIIIDDYGNHGEGLDKMLNLPIPTTAAVMPFQPFSSQDAELAHKAGLDVIIHMPMEAMTGKRSWLGKRAITCDLPIESIDEIIIDSIKEIKYAVGLNNHMGSKVTQDKRIMKAVLQTLKDNNLYIVDSKTSTKSVVKSLAQELNVSYFSRDVFLDGDRREKEIEKQLTKLGEVALKSNYAIGIGHVGKEGGNKTAKAIKNMVPTLQKKGITFITLSQLNDLLNKK